MWALIRLLAAAVALALSTGSALATMGKTTTDVALRRAPTVQAELILNLSQGTLVNVGGCSRGWCAVTWNKYSGYVRESALQFLSIPASGPPAIPVFPPYPYKAGHYPTADAYYDLPPYAAIDPSFYRWRHFLTAQERNRYRYMPYIFHGVPSVYLEKPTFRSAETTAPEVSPPTAAPAPSLQAPEVSPPSAVPGPSPQPAERPLGVTVTELRDVTKGWSVKRSILGQPVYNEKEERVGSIDDIIVTRDKAVSYAIINAGGFLGLMKHNVEIPVYQFKLVDNKFVLPGVTKDALKARPELSEVANGWSVKRSILGQPVYNEKEERVGWVDDIIVTPDKAVSYAIVNAGGFLGLMKHNVAIPVSQFKLVHNKLVLPGATKNALKASPEFQYPQ